MKILGRAGKKGDFKAIDFNQTVKNSPNDLGFDYAYGHSGSLDMAPYVYVENGIVTSQPDRTTINTGKYSWWREGPTGADFVHQDVTPNFFSRAINYIKEKSKQEEPFFLYLALPSPHTPILPSIEWLGKSGLNPYADFTMMIDHYIGEIVETTRNQGIEENTMIIFTSDNGCSPEARFDELESQGHFPSYIFRGHKADIFEGGHRVPFIVKWPKTIEANQTNDHLICTTDLISTLANLTGYVLSDNEGEDSYSFLAHLKETPGKKVMRPDIIHSSIDGSFAIRKGHWKLIMVPHSGGWSFPNPGSDKTVIDSLPALQLYNLLNDPGENSNLYNEHPTIVQELTSLLIEYIHKGRSTPGKAQKNDSIDFEWTQIEFMK